MLLEYARKLGGGIRKLEKLYLETGNCIRKLGGEVMKTPGMMICERSILHKAEAHFHPFASQLREWFQQKQQWLPVVPHKAVAEVSKIGNL